MNSDSDIKKKHKKTLSASPAPPQLWEFIRAPIKTKMSVVGSDGERNVWMSQFHQICRQRNDPVWEMRSPWGWDRWNYLFCGRLARVCSMEAVQDQTCPDLVSKGMSLANTMPSDGAFWEVLSSGALEEKQWRKPELKRQQEAFSNQSMCFTLISLLTEVCTIHQM